MLMAAAVAAFGISSCSKELEETTTQEEAKELILDITVANLDGSVETRAVKKDWEVGDRINIWFDNHMGKIPDMVIKYDGAEWHRDLSAAVSGLTPEAESGRIKYCYDGSNDLSKYTYGDLNGQPVTANLLYCNDTWYHAPEYYTISDNVLSLSLMAWIIRSEFQVVIPSIDPEKYMLKSDHLKTFNGIVVNISNINYNPISQVNYYTNGVANADGAAFYFSVPDTYDATDYSFTLENKETGIRYIYTAKGKSHTKGTFTAIKLNLENFTVDNDNSAEVNIPDPAFKAYCIENFDKNHDSKLSEAEAALVTTIDVTGLGIESLEGLQYFTSLRHLHCNNNMLTSLDVSNNLQLECIECIGTNDYKLSSLDLTKNTKLTSLRLNNNNLTDLDVTKNTRLDYLTLSGNPLSSSIDLSQNVWLTTLSLYNCSLPYIDLSKTIRLNHIDLRRNNLTTLDISHIGLGDTWRWEVIEQFWCEDNPDLKEIIARRLQTGNWSKDSGVKITRIDI